MHRQLNLKVLNRHQFYRPAVGETLSLESIVSTARRSSTLDGNDAVRKVVLAADDDDGAAPLGIVAVADAVARRYHRLLRCYLIDYYNELVTVDNSTVCHQMVHRRHRRLHCDDRFAVAEAQRLRSGRASCSDGSERTRRSRRQSSGTQRQQHHQRYLPSPT